MLKCLDCGHVFSEDEVEYWRESRGEYWGMSCSETVSGCPCCRGDYENAFMCEDCGEYFTMDELDGDYLCKKCRENFDEKE